MSGRIYRLKRASDGSCRATVYPACGEPYDLWRSHVARYGAKHSPDGFEWGYGGSGPAELARAILSDLFGREAEPAEYQRLKREVIAHVPYIGAELHLAADEGLRGYWCSLAEPPAIPGVKP